MHDAGWTQDLSSNGGDIKRLIPHHSHQIHATLLQLQEYNGSFVANDLHPVIVEICYVSAGRVDSSVLLFAMLPDRVLQGRFPFQLHDTGTRWGWMEPLDMEMVQHQTGILKVFVAPGKVHIEAEGVARPRGEWLRLLTGSHRIVSGGDPILEVRRNWLVRFIRVEVAIAGQLVVAGSGLIRVVVQFPEHESSILALAIVVHVFQTSGESRGLEGHRQKVRFPRTFSFPPPDETLGYLVGIVLVALDRERAKLGQVSPLSREPVPPPTVVVPLVVPDQHGLMPLFPSDQDQIRHEPHPVQHRGRDPLDALPSLDVPHTDAAVGPVDGGRGPRVRSVVAPRVVAEDLVRVVDIHKLERVDHRDGFRRDLVLSLQLQPVALCRREKVCSTRGDDALVRALDDEDIAGDQDAEDRFPRGVESDGACADPARGGRVVKIDEREDGRRVVTGLVDE